MSDEVAWWLTWACLLLLTYYTVAMVLR